MKLGYHVLYSAYSLLAVVLALLWINPANHGSDAQKAILAEYDGLYCIPVEEARKNPLQHSAVAAAMSRIVVKADLGILAIAEYARCKAGL